MSSNAELLARARTVMPGGVSSPVRSFREVGMDPPFVARGRDSRLETREGRSYIDLVMSWGPLVLGHAHPAVVDAVQRAAHDGLTFGATCEAEVELAERVVARVPFAEKVRFTSSGTEAAMTAVRLARGATGRDRILKFAGCYHGHADAVLVKAGSGLATFGVPSSAGVPAQVSALTDVLPLDDQAALTAWFDRHGRELAAVIVEPLPANAGLLEQRLEFLQALHILTRHHRAVLIFDEVISGFRVAPGGMAQRTGITPDLVVLGKILGGGMPVGAVAGPAAMMDLLAPLGPVYQAGTLSGNPIAMAAGVATLDALGTSTSYERLDAVGGRLEMGLRAVLRRFGDVGSVARVGSIVWVCLQPGPTPRAFAQIGPDAARRYGAVHREMMRRDVWIAPSAFEVAFLSLAHSDADVDAVIRAFGDALAAVADRGELS